MYHRMERHLRAGSGSAKLFHKRYFSEHLQDTLFDAATNASLLYRKSNLDGFRHIHRELAKAIVSGVSIELRIVENCHTVNLNIRELTLIKELASGGLNGTN